MPQAIPARRLRPLFDQVIALVRAHDLDELLDLGAQAARGLTNARYGAIGVWQRDRPDRLARFVTSGMDPATADQIASLPEGKGLLGLARDHVVAIANIATHPRSVGFPESHPAMRSFLGAPISVRDAIYGTVYVADRADGGPFDLVDAAVLEALATALAAVIESLALRDELAATEVTTDRLRIARDLHDDVIQRLFGVGLTIQAALREIEAPHALELLGNAMDDLDATIQGLRTTIFDLEQARRTSLRGEVLDLVERLTAATGMRRSVAFDGPVDFAVAASLRPHLVAAVRELLTNAVKHAQAQRVDLRIAVDARTVTLEVDDDGVGFDSDGATLGHGLANLSARAHELGGAFRLERRPTGGTMARFSLPLRTATVAERHET
ncbi:GAF domain-containing sensor histidine kinase [Acidimicrobium ferrooxidans]|uniref:GAF domain-containing sensor histidine kinase n=1 Tax=Acidimicrobium ferrooxidans TaxID=53635 RepID=UPI0002EC78BB|nr:GAF domain-containing protein [Acidimicrobium ferrooxidans]